MRYNSVGFWLAALAPVVLAQTKSLCDPLEKDDCPPDAAFGNCNKEQVFDFSSYQKGDDWRKDKSFSDLWTPDVAVKDSKSKMLTINDNGAIFTITGDSQAPLIKSSKYLFFGKVDVTVKAAPGQGIVTSIVLESDDRDEIDWEWVGKFQDGVQTNFFSKGVNDFTHGKTHAVSFNPMEGLHTYSIEWTESKITFSVDGNVVRTATPAEADNGKKWPQTPAMIKLGTWVGGKPGGAEGTIEWAGGLVNMAEAPFVAWYKEIRVTDYCGGYDKAAEYVYGDNSGSKESIKVVGSSKKVEKDEDEEKETSSKVTKPTSTKTTSGGADQAEETGSGDETSSGSGSSSTSAPGGDSGSAALKGSSAVAGVVFLAFLLLG